MPTPDARFTRLLGYLDADPENLALLADAADAAVAEGETAMAADLVDRYAAVAPLTPPLLNLLAVCALAEGRWADAAAILESVRADRPEDAVLRLNLARAREGLCDYEGVLTLLEDAPPPADATPLKLRALHHLGRLDEALALGRGMDPQIDDPALWGALASIAMDAEALDLAALWASRAPLTADGLAAQGLLALTEGETPKARLLLEDGLSRHPGSARLQLGLASVLLSEGDAAAAAERFDSAANIFGDHLGSWTAAGWAWLIAGDRARAQARFETVVALDDSFGEGHGGLAVIALQDGRPEDARRRAEIALRLDPESLGGLLTRALLLEQAGESALADRLRQGALKAPIGPGGHSILQMAAKLAVNLR
ncbi:hypothetical protein GCM10017620_31210 [Brevundimonas intermedia]|uniref:Tetratricopeptide repeat protein n=1 Tax=Brevundimonas intermedia TaxID=74315 RepID=A0ABQ5TCJ9_9CAUL|nr:tetratricopeptide repeat protein [Brevundimonas intermedia]GLK50147.1 hypothetical protein GCM10017620_31210 [Brevundimonas intermedia]